MPVVKVSTADVILNGERIGVAPTFYELSPITVLTSTRSVKTLPKGQKTVRFPKLLGVNVPIVDTSEYEDVAVREWRKNSVGEKYYIAVEGDELNEILDYQERLIKQMSKDNALLRDEIKRLKG